eukprot:CAMPEP_0179051508 /NCGR_PEP_ID=MMETSP0796-20121207/21282_1 /TAXON_ID=73915 /ORGANISM="Pyrodinium bahamense, Strain pbaha01" /LENGTH=78 /DNA_ID=CAMNT_0020748053 /DNA_START=89 /DNA_END=325 /DNA_ORIENTATION=-
MSEAKAPSPEELAAKAGDLKKVETKDASGGFDETPYKKAWDDAGGDAAKVAESLGMKKVPANYDEYINMCKLGKFKDT